MYERMNRDEMTNLVGKDTLSDLESMDCVSTGHRVNGKLEYVKVKRIKYFDRFGEAIIFAYYYRFEDECFSDVDHYSIV